MSLQKLPSYAVPKLAPSEKRISTSLRISNRVLLYAKERLDVSATAESCLREALVSMGVDLGVPHDDEVVGYEENDKTKPMTFAEGKRLGLYDIRGRLIQGAFLGGAAPEGEGEAVL